jgi:hypothetical protein
MIANIKENDLASLTNALAGKFGWSDKDPQRRFYLQNVIIGTVSQETITDSSGRKACYLVPIEVPEETPLEELGDI